MPTKDAIVAASLFVALFVVFWFSPNRGLGDSHYTILVSESILRHGHFYLDEHFILPLDRDRYPSILEDRAYPYQVLARAGHVIYAYDPGGPLLAIPFVAAINVFGPSAIAPDGGYDGSGEKLIQQILASGLMAGLAVLLFATSRSMLPRRWSVLVALAAVLGTQIWSIASRALWSHTWGVFLFGIVVLLLLDGERRAKQLTIGRAAFIATILAWAYFARPTNAIYIVAVSGYVLYAHRRAFFTYALVGAMWFGIFSLYSLAYLDQLLPIQTLQASRTDSFNVATATVGTSGVVDSGDRPAETVANAARPAISPRGSLLGTLISPSRGLFIFVPGALFVAYLLVRYRRTLPNRRLALVALIGMAGQIALTSVWRGWAGGHSYGPRLLTELVPWLAVLGILGLRARLDGRSYLGRSSFRVEMAAGALLLTLSVAIHARGALAEETLQWNATPVSITQDTERLWDWQSPQFLAGLAPPATQSWLARARREADPGALIFVEVANDQRTPAVNAVLEVDSIATPTFTISGWAIDQKRRRAAGGVILSFDDATHVVATYGFDRKDVAAYFGEARYRFSGFSASIPVSSLGPGQHVVRPRIIAADNLGFYDLPYSLVVDVR